MRLRLLSALAAALAAAALVTAPVSALADSYSLSTLHSDAGYFFYGMDDSGKVVFDNGIAGSGSTSCSVDTCYYSYLNGSLTATSFTAPAITIDDGSACSLSLPGWTVLHSACNNGHTAFTGRFSGNPPTQVFFTSSPASPSGGPNFGAGPIFMNSLGDVVLDDQFSDTWYEAIDLTTAATPEPASFLLLATAGLVMFGIGAFRRGLVNA